MRRWLMTAVFTEVTGFGCLMAPAPVFAGPAFTADRMAAAGAEAVKGGKPMSKSLVLAVLALLASITILGGGDRAEAAHVTCGQTLTANTTLDEDLTCATQSGLIIGANGITLDCAGFEIVGPGTDTSIGILLDGRTGVVVTNCEVMNFGRTGFEIKGSSGNTLTRNEANNNGTAFFLWNGSSNNTLTKNDAKNNNFGFYLSGVGGAPNNTLTNNEAKNNTSIGFVVENSPNNTLTGNESKGNGTHGFLVYLGSSVNNTLTGNEAEGNGFDGFVLASNASNNTLTGNEAEGNGQVGFHLLGNSSNNTLTGNEACGNGTFDAFQEAGSVNTFVNNEFCTTSGI